MKGDLTGDEEVGLEVPELCTEGPSEGPPAKLESLQGGKRAAGPYWAGG